MYELETAVATRLFELGAVKFGAFKLRLHQDHPDATLSPIFLNLRTPDNKDGKLDPETVDMIGRLFYAAANPGSIGYVGEQLYATNRRRNSHFHYVSGVPNAGVPFVDAFMNYTSIDGGVYERLELLKEEKDGKRHIAGLKNQAVRRSATVKLIDDLITHADSKLEAIKILEQAGLFVRDVYVLVDREQGGTAELERAGYRVHSIFPITQLLRFYREQKMIRASKEAEVLEYLANNQS